jgi:hypothetical protein
LVSPGFGPTLSFFFLSHGSDNPDPLCLSEVDRSTLMLVCFDTLSDKDLSFRLGCLEMLSDLILVCLDTPSDKDLSDLMLGCLDMLRPPFALGVLVILADFCSESGASFCLACDCVIAARSLGSLSRELCFAEPGIFAAAPDSGFALSITVGRVLL